MFSFLKQLFVEHFLYKDIAKIIKINFHPNPNEHRILQYLENKLNISKTYWKLKYIKSNLEFHIY